MNSILGGNMFDLNHDSELDAIERAAEFQFLNDVVFAEAFSDDDDDSE